MNTETWLLVRDFPNYEVSDAGRVRSKARRYVGSDSGWRILKLTERFHRGRLSHLAVNLGRGNLRRVHHLVLDAFVGARPSGLEGCHNDGNPANNRVRNLRWDTRLANMQDVKRHGTHWSPFPNIRGEAHKNTHLTENDVREIRAAITDRRGHRVELARKYRVSDTTIKRIVDRRVWAHV